MFCACFQRFTRYASLSAAFHEERDVGLLRSFVLIDVPNKDCAALVIHEGFDPIPDMSRSIDASIFVMCHAMFDATHVLKHIGPALDRRHLSR
jgi:hypothetical protein